jgi:vacuole membrane protein 1
MLQEVLLDVLSQANQFCLTYIGPIIVLLLLAFTFVKCPGPHEKYRQIVFDIGYFSLYWIFLGVASSIGLGTGLHTFVLYLGPYIAQVTLAANECGYVPAFSPSYWTFDGHFEMCK